MSPDFTTYAPELDGALCGRAAAGARLAFFCGGCHDDVFAFPGWAAGAAWHTADSAKTAPKADDKRRKALFLGIIEIIVKLIIKRNQRFKASRRRRRSPALPAWQRVLRRLGWSVLGGAGLGGLAFLAAWIFHLRTLPPVLRPASETRALVIVDAGHGGVDGGTQGFGALEKHLALDTSVRLARELRLRGLRPLMLREDDTALSLDERVQRANAHAEAAAFVSVHYNFSTASPSVHGAEAYYAAPKDLSAQNHLAKKWRVPVDSPEIEAASRSLAEKILDSLSREARTPSRGARNRTDLAVTRRTHMPAVLVECAFLSNPGDAARAKTAAWQGDLARGIADGVHAWIQSRNVTTP